MPSVTGVCTFICLFGNEIHFSYLSNVLRIPQLLRLHTLVLIDIGINEEVYLHEHVLEKDLLNIRYVIKLIIFT